MNGTTAGPGPAPQRPLVRRIAAPLGVMAAAAAAFGYVGAFDPNETGHYPVCPLLRMTGVYCPGCGGLRTAYAVLHGNLAEACGLNLLAVVLFAAYAAFTALWLYREALGQPFRVRFRPVHWWLIAAANVLFMIVRNLPFGAFLAP